MRQFKAEEISMKVRDGVLSVNARQESKSEFSTVFRQYSRHFSLPEGVIVDQLRSTLSPEGVMTITAPMVEDKETEDSKEEEEEEQEAESEGQTDVTTESPPEPAPTLPDVAPELNPEKNREKEEERINVIQVIPQ